MAERTLAGGWDVVASDGMTTHDPDGITTGRARREISGYDTTGQLNIDTMAAPDVIEITVVLADE